MTEATWDGNEKRKEGQAVDEKILELLKQHMPEKRPDWQFWLIVATMIGTAFTMVYRMDKMETTMARHIVSDDSRMSSIELTQSTHEKAQLRDKVAEQAKELRLYREAARKGS